MAKNSKGGRKKNTNVSNTSADTTSADNTSADNIEISTNESIKETPKKTVRQSKNKRKKNTEVIATTVQSSKVEVNTETVETDATNEQSCQIEVKNTNKETVKTNNNIMEETNNVIEEINDENSTDDKTPKTKRVTYAELDTDFETMEKKLVELKSTVGNMMVMFRELRKKQRRYAREISKRGRKKIEEDMLRPKQKPKGFQVPIRITDELCDFMRVEHGTKMNCAEAGKRVHMYIKEHKLQDPSNGININLDSKLKSLLQVEKEVQLTYFNLQHYLSRHYIKED